MISFRPLTEADLPLFLEWLRRPHVAEWWQPTPTLEELRDDYLPAMTDALPLDAPGGTVAYLVYRNNEPFGFIQAYRVMAHQKDGWWLEETDPCALGIDQLIGEPDLIGKGVGTEMIKAFVARLWSDPRVTAIQTDPDPRNARAIACYRKVGFQDVAPVATLDGPALLMRMHRPQQARA